MIREEWEQRQRNGWLTGKKTPPDVIYDHRGDVTNIKTGIPPVFKKGSFQREVMLDLSKEGDTKCPPDVHQSTPRK